MDDFETFLLTGDFIDELPNKYEFSLKDEDNVWFESRFSDYVIIFSRHSKLYSVQNINFVIIADYLTFDELKEYLNELDNR